jgi:hypothetical protein
MILFYCYVVPKKTVILGMAGILRKMQRGNKTIMLILGILGLAVVHFLVSFFVSFAAGIGGNTPYGGALSVLSKILTFPLWLYKSNPNAEQSLLTWVPWAMISLVWGSALTFAIRHFTKN